ncbi:DUF2252 family protein [Photobacterium sp. TLY01]|uniref:DUF2252 family protein n=1 Tax=Photobacterium sp. TLY01 TaxID=2907534 RepID=UPI001F256B91|nr:DUF2252 family protein [Photobacterium sp. TLY01]UIP29033.1 DUF2252 domain-containing protein [Photobacterium sp. TLY01]
MTTRREFLCKQIRLIDGIVPNAENPLNKHLKMAWSPFQFFRGTAQLFYADLAQELFTLPDLLLARPGQTFIMGDCHLSNFGFLTEEGSQGDQVIFSPNDFDDACVGYAVWDIARYLTSLALASDFGCGLLEGRYLTDEVDIDDDLNAVNTDDVRQASEAFLHAYTRRLQDVIEDNDARYNVLKKFDEDHVLDKYCRKASKRAAGGKDFLSKSQLAKSTTFEEGKLRFADKPLKYQRIDTAEYAEAEKTFRPYLDDEVLDIVIRLDAGTGSNNVGRYYFLVGPSDVRSIDDLPLCHIVEVKQQRQAAPIFAFPDINPVNALNPAHLTADCQRFMQRRPDLLLDEVIWRDKHWLVRSRHHARLSLKPEDLILNDKDPSTAFCQYASACGEALALAHSRGDRRSARFEQFMLEGLPGNQDALLTACQQYSEQVIQDYNIHCGLLGK